MSRHSPVLLLFSLFAWMVVGSCNPLPAGMEPVQALLLSGRNNHDWKCTTEVLVNMFRENPRFSVQVTEQPDTLRAADLKGYDVIISNWNSWPENDLRWPAALEAGILDFIRQGGGMVFFHASTSAFYQWPAFREISVAAWQEETWHGPKGPVQVEITDSAHPITAGMSGFRIFDELWINAGRNETFHVLGTASKVQTDQPYQGSQEGPSDDGVADQASVPQPAIFVKEYGEGRIFHTILGHDGRTLLNTGFRTLMLRGTEWAASGRVSIAVPQELQTDSPRTAVSRRETGDLSQATSAQDADYSWVQTDSSFGLKQGKQIQWQFNHGTRHGKPFFHPVRLGRERITCLSPADHPWHLGQWFCWKYIEGLNYWEFDRQSFASEGITNVRIAEYTTHPDHAAEVRLEIEYHAPGKDPVLKENRRVRIAAPGEEQLTMDYKMTFVPLVDELELSRTPIEGEPDGKSWGGYAGLSMRFNQDFTAPFWLAEAGADFQPKGAGGRWLYMGFTGLHGGQIGTAIFIAPETEREGSGWYLINTPDIPFFYFSPAFLYHRPLLLNKGDTLELAYRVLHLSGTVNREMLQDAYEEYVHSGDRDKPKLIP